MKSNVLSVLPSPRRLRGEVLSQTLNQANVVRFRLDGDTGIVLGGNLESMFTTVCISPMVSKGCKVEIVG
jgi:hypothetical protein